MKFKVVDVQSADWHDALQRIPGALSDINFTPGWYTSWKDHEDAEPLCMIGESDNTLFLYPFFYKSIDGYPEVQGYYDIQSAYGYGGIICNTGQIDNNLLSEFNNHANDWMSANRVVAEFIREHPLLDTCRRPADYVPVRRNVYVETKPGYILPEKRARQNIARARSYDGISVLIDADMLHLDTFIRLYELNTQRIKMDKYYNFPPAYFYGVKTLLGSYARLIHILFEGQIINSVLFFEYGNKGTMHLSGANHEYQHLRGNDLLYASVIEHCIEQGLQILTIGGGTSYNEDDTLFRFKSKFGSIYKDVMIGRKIILPDIYTALNKEWANRHPELKEKYAGFFLKYRQES